MSSRSWRAILFRHHGRLSGEVGNHQRGMEAVAGARRRDGRRVTAAACLLAALSVTACVLVLVGGSAHHAAPTALESINILSGLGADAAKAIAGMRQLWDGAIPAPAAGAAALPAGTGQPRFQNVDVALNSAGQAALMARQVR